MLKLGNKMENKNNNSQDELTLKRLSLTCLTTMEKLKWLTIVCDSIDSKLI